MFATPTAKQTADALTIVTHPEQFGDMPSLRAAAWATLLANRGQRMDQLRIGRMQRDQRALAVAAPPIQYIAIQRGA